MREICANMNRCFVFHRVKSNLWTFVCTIYASSKSKLKARISFVKGQEIIMRAIWYRPLQKWRQNLAHKQTIKAHSTFNRNEAMKNRLVLARFCSKSLIIWLLDTLIHIARYSLVFVIYISLLS